jgi:hypothetical protein
MERLPSWFKLICVVSGQKHPTSKGWGHEASDEYINQLDKATRDGPKGNYGVLCGRRSKIIVIDYDTDKVPECNVTLESLKEHHGDTLIVQTPKGGFHVYHEYSPKFDHWNGVTGIEGFVDIRTNGNYVVGPGSIVNGKRYRIVNQADCKGMSNETFDVFDEHVGGIQKKERNENQLIDPGKYDKLLNENGFTNIRWVNSYNFTCDQRGRGSVCPLCDHSHENNHFYLKETSGGSVYVKNHSNKCKKFYLINNEKKNTTYEEMKKEIDKEVFKVLNPLCYCIIKNGDFQIEPFNRLREIYSTRVLFDEKQREYNFFDRWTKDSTKVEYNKMDFLPDPLYCPDDIYNLWNGFQHEDIKGDVTKFQTLMNLIDGGSEYMTNYLAHLVQKPGEMPLTGIVLRGIDGCGKSSVVEIMRRLVGDEHYFTTSDPSKEVFCRFSEAINRKMVINFNEAEAKKMFVLNEDIKNLVTSPTAIYEKKGMTPIVTRSFVRVIVTTNNSTPLKISLTDRRWAVFNVFETYVQDEPFWDDMYKWINNKENINFIYNYLKNIDLTNVHLKNIPKTSALNEIKQACLPLEIKWLTDFIHEYHVPSIKNSDLFDSYKSFIPAKVEVDVRSFGLMLKKLNVDGFTKERVTEGIIWRINYDKVKQWLDNKGVDQSGYS